jgi:6-phosphofructokinase 1
MPFSGQIVRCPTLGDAAYRSPFAVDGCSGCVPDDLWVRNSVETTAEGPVGEDLLFEKAGPREKIYFDPLATKAAIVTCGGLCPGLNDVIRSVFLELAMNYGVREVVGIRYGYQGLNPQAGIPPVRLTPDMVESIHREGGTILGSSRGQQEPAVMVDFLQQQGINILFTVGGDGTQRGSLKIYEEIARRGLKIAIVGIPKTIDNDIPYCDHTFGTATAVGEAMKVLDGAHAESKGVPYGIGLVKVMGRDAGFIAAAATVASQDVNFALVPESPFALDGECGLLPLLRKRMIDRRHAVIVVAEGAGQELFQTHSLHRDASGNVKYEDIGPFLKQQILNYFTEHGPKVDVKYIDPSYIIRSVPANSDDGILCDRFARHAVHAAMAGKTGVLIGHLSSRFVHVPIAMLSGQKRRLPLDGDLWRAVLAATGQPREMK